MVLNDSGAGRCSWKSICWAGDAVVGRVYAGLVGLILGGGA